MALPAMNPPPWIHTNTGFFPSPLSAGVQMFRFWQSSPSFCRSSRPLYMGKGEGSPIWGEMGPYT